jgi:hypothetical protein
MGEVRLQRCTVKEYTLNVDLDERGMFHAHVEDEDGTVVFELSNENEVLNNQGQVTGREYGALWLVEAGYMKHRTDVDGLQGYLIHVGVIPVGSRLTMGAR